MRRFLAAFAAVGAVALAGCGSTGAVTIKPGESLNAAAARAGKDGLVVLAPGDYPAQTVNTGTSGDCTAHLTDPGNSTDCRTFLVPSGAAVHIGSLRIEGAGTAFLANRGDLTIDGAYSLSGASQSVIRGAIIDPADGDPGVYLDHVSDFALVDSEVKGVTDNDGVDIYGGPTGSKNTLLQDNDIHGVRVTANSCQHTDGVQVAGTSGPGNTGTIIRHNHIWDIDQNADIQLDTAPTQVGTNEVIEGNTLGAVNYVVTSCVPSPNPRSLNVSGNNLRVTGNSWTLKAFVYPGSGRVESNSGAGTSGNCSGYAWNGNIWTGGGC